MKILVAGATGTVGRQIIKHLLADGVGVRALTRNAATANLPAGVEVVQADLAQPETLTNVFDGITGLHLIGFDGSNYGPLQTGPEIMALAKAAGVRKVTILRGGDAGPMEAAMEASGLEWTHLIPVEFMSNMLEWRDSICADGVVREPFGNRKSAIVHESDIGAVAAKVLTSDGHAGKFYPITGPEALTPIEMVNILSEASGRQIEFIELTEAQARERWQQAGFDEATIDYFVWMYRDTPEIGYTVVSTVEDLTGRPALRFADWAAANAAAFR